MDGSIDMGMDADKIILGIEIKNGDYFPAGSMLLVRLRYD